MEKHTRLKLLVTAAFSFAACATRSYPSGGDWYDELAPSLADTVNMLPAKSMGRIFQETSPRKKAAPSPDFENEIMAVADRLQHETPGKLVAEIDKLLAKAREDYFTGGRDSCALLHDVRDVLSGPPVDPAAAAEYIRWRVGHNNAFLNNGKSYEDSLAEMRALDLEKQADKASGPLKAHWLYLCGAIRFKAGDREDCRAIFERIVKEFPDDPRAEMALFMVGRCALSHSRIDHPKDDNHATARRKAAEIFQRYLSKYPEGRMIADVRGWLGALAFDDEDYLKALEYYIAQAETPGHPETLKSAVFMCESSLARLAANPDGDAGFAMAARHPRIAMGFTYLVLGAPEADNYDGKVDKPADVKKWRRMMLPRIAAQVVKQKDLYKDGDWQPRYLAMLALAASATGDQTQALKLTEIAPAALERSDDLLFARALAEYRAGRAAEAIDTYRKLLDRFPDSPLATGVRLRLAMALQDAHRTGEAIAQLKLLGKFAGENQTGLAHGTYERYTAGDLYPSGLDEWSLDHSAVYPDLSGADLDQVQQMIDTLLNFAPLPELIAALGQPLFSDGEKSGLRDVIAERYLEQENFREAKKYMTEAQFNLVAGGLEKLTIAVENAKEPKEKAAAMLRLGDAWSAARGKILGTPLDLNVPFVNRMVLSGFVRRSNGRVFGFKNMDAELENRDELRVASRWWMRAARTLPGSAVAANARWKALDAMAAIASASEYAERRAGEINGNAVSRELYNRLKTECPDSLEARRLAVYWDFPKPPAEDEEPKSSIGFGDYFQPGEIVNSQGYIYSDYGAFGVKEDNRAAEYQNEENPFSKRLSALREEAENWSAPRLAREVEELDLRAKSEFGFIEGASCTNMLDDLVQFLSEPAITPEIQKTYVNIRLDVLHRTSWGGAPAHPPISTEDTDEAVDAEIAKALANPAMKPVADYLEFSRIGLVAGARISVDTGSVDKDDSHFTFPSRDYARMERMTRDFLKKYPHSRKREAAMFVLARSVQALSRPYIYYVQTPAAGVPKDRAVFKPERKSYQVEAFDPKRVLKALDDYDKEFPDGRYADDVWNYRINVLWRMHDWGKALDLTIAQLHDEDTPLELRQEAATRLANIFAQLAEAPYRADILDAIKARPAAVLYLKRFVKKTDHAPGHPLRYLQDYLTDQIKS